MWRKRKQKNRRLGREYVLDVKLRSSQVRATRARMAAVALAIIFAIVLGAFFLWRGGQWALNQLVYENSAFGIQNIQVQTDGVLAPDQIRRWAGVRPGQNLLALDLARVKRDLEMVSVIDSVSVERILPHTLRLRVIEREPWAQINVPRPRPGGGIQNVTYYLDADGWVMTPLEAAQCASQSLPPEALPIISGLVSSDLQVGRRIALPQVQAALQLLVAFGSSSMQSLADIQRIDVSATDVLTVTTAQGSEVVFRMDEFDQQLRRWQVIQAEGQSRSKAIATMDLAVTNNIPVRWIEAAALPTVPRKNPKPLRPRKKHV